jgi:hypothetical protein
MCKWSDLPASLQGEAEVGDGNKERAADRLRLYLLQLQVLSAHVDYFILY